MPTVLLRVSDAAIREAAEALRAGKLVAFPTETVYGLGARADRPEAVRAIFTAKGRPPGNPLIVHAADRASARALAAEWSGEAEALASAFWPGPLTLVVARAPGAVADEVTAGGPTVGVRVPEHPVALALLREAGVPVAAPSANPSQSISPTTAEHVTKALGGAVDVVLDGGPTRRGIESTIVDVSRRPMRLLRHGAISLAEIARFGEVIDAAGGSVDLSARADAPGQHAKHYAPRARALLVPAGQVRTKLDELRAGGSRAGALERATDGGAMPRERATRGDGERTRDALVERLPGDPEGYARELYAALHRLDDAGCEWIVVAEVPDEPAWAAVRDRLRRATAS